VSSFRHPGTVLTDHTAYLTVSWAGARVGVTFSRPNSPSNSSMPSRVALYGS
jgi:hypothetical protein